MTKSRNLNYEIIQVRNKWQSFTVPKSARENCFQAIQPLAQTALLLIDFLQYTNSSKAKRLIDDFSKLSGIVSRDLFLLGIASNLSSPSEETYELLHEATKPIVSIVVEICHECSLLPKREIQISDKLKLFTALNQITLPGIYQREGRAWEGVIRNSLSLQKERIQELLEGKVKSSHEWSARMSGAYSLQLLPIASLIFQIGSSNNNSKTKINAAQTDNELKASYLFSHVKLPAILFNFVQQSYESIKGAYGQQFIDAVWQKALSTAKSHAPLPSSSLSWMPLTRPHELFVIEMPPPRTTPDPFYLAILYKLDYSTIVPKVETVRYFTLELGRNPYTPSEEYHFCEWQTLTQHVNYGQLVNQNVETFIGAVISMIPATP